jgi:hypothetical protein
MSIDLSRLSEPFPADDIEWRVSRAGVSRGKVWCFVLAYLTARAIQERLDAVCGPENWRLEEPRILDVGGKPAFACGISIRVGDEWVTKWDVSEPTSVEPAKGGWSGAMKRAGAQWGIGRYLYHLTEHFADVADEEPERGDKANWNYAKIKQDGTVYYWRAPRLPGWALPKEHPVSANALSSLKHEWRDKFYPEGKEVPEGAFTAFVHKHCGEFPVADNTCWRIEALETCQEVIRKTTDPSGPDSDVPFE